MWAGHWYEWGVRLFKLRARARARAPFVYQWGPRLSWMPPLTPDLLHHLWTNGPLDGASVPALHPFVTDGPLVRGRCQC